MLFASIRRIHLSPHFTSRKVLFIHSVKQYQEVGRHTAKSTTPKNHEYTQFELEVTLKYVHTLINFRSILVLHADSDIACQSGKVLAVTPRKDVPIPLNYSNAE